jgi:quercetin dioxygenase-like cupin family protein
MSYPDIEIASAGNIFSRMMKFNRGDIEVGHTHHFDHITLLTTGKLKVTIEGQETVFEAPKHIFIKADQFHELEALEDNTVAFCIHALRDVDGEILAPDCVPCGSNVPDLIKMNIVHPVVKDFRTSERYLENETAN